MKDDMDLLSAKELAFKLKRSVRYVRRMSELGFRMVGGRSTVSAALFWLAKNGPPFSNKRRG
jgi:hypothetical protein